MAHRINALAAQTQLALKVAACLGLRFELALLARVCGVGPEVARDWLRPALAGALLQAVGGPAASAPEFQFAQAAVHRAAAALPVAVSLPEVHLRTGRALWRQAATQDLEPQLFGIVDHFNQAQGRIHNAAERMAVAELNLRAGLLAQEAGEQQAAASYFHHGLNLLPEGGSSNHESLHWELNAHLVECESVLNQLTPFVADAATALPGAPDGAALLRAQLDENVRLLELQQQELKQVKAEAEAALRARAEFLARMGHEIRTPMNAIIGLSHLALKNESDARQRNYLSQIRQSGLHLLAVMNDMLDYSRVEAGQMDMEMVPFALDTVFETLAGLCAEKAHSKGLELIWHIAHGVPHHLIGDPLRLGQVLIHYTRNALHCTTRGEVEIAVSVVAQEADAVKLRFEVRDTGIGLSAQQIEGLYAHYSPHQSSSTGKHGAGGLGLAISRRLVALMGGEVGVHSKPGQGSTFWFTASLGLGAVPARQVLGADLRRKRVLVVDDNANAAAVLCEQLLTLGCMAHGLVSGQAALAELRRAAASGEPYDVLMTDWQMPEMDGLELVRHIHALGLEPAPLTVLVTAYGTDSAGPQAAQAGFYRLLQKPVSQSMLFDAMLDLFGVLATPDDAPAPPAALAEPSLLNPVRGARILLAEDNAVNQQVAREILECEGFEVALADNGQQAIYLLSQSSDAQRPFDLVLMDMRMPVLDGVSAAHLIRSMPEYARLPIVAMTANVQPSDRQLCLRSGMNDFVTKPIDPTALWQALARWIRPRQGLGPQAAA